MTEHKQAPASPAPSSRNSAGGGAITTRYIALKRVVTVSYAVVDPLDVPEPDAPEGKYRRYLLPVGFRLARTMGGEWCVHDEAGRGVSLGTHAATGYPQLIPQCAPWRILLEPQPERGFL
jgi:hypothetical protein